MRHEMNCAGMTRAFFLSHCGGRVMCVPQGSHHKQRKQCATAHDSATARRTTLYRSEEGRSTSVSLGTKQTDKFSILRGSQNKPLVYLCKHSNFLNTDRMGPQDGPNCRSHETLLHIGIQNSDKDVPSSFLTAQILRQRSVHQNAVEHLCL